MSDEQSFSIGIFPGGKPEQADIDAAWLTDREFKSEDGVLFSKEVDTGKTLIYDLSSYSIMVKNGDSDPVVVADSSPSVHYLAGLWKTLTGETL